MKLLFLSLLFVSFPLTGCGDCNRGFNVVTGYPNSGYPIPPPGIGNRGYQECLRRNPYSYATQGWFVWVDNCKLRFGIRELGAPVYPDYSAEPLK